MKNFLYSILILGFLVGCKKEKQEPPASTGSHNGGSGVNYSAILTASSSQNTQGDTLDAMVGNSGIAWFGNTPYPGMSNTNYSQVDTLSLNGISFKFDSYCYRDTTYAISGFPMYQWHVKGNSVIPDFDYTNTNEMPSFSGCAAFPDSIDRSASITIPLSGGMDYNRGFVMLDDGMGHRIFRQFDAMPSSMTFTPTELSAFNSTSSAFFYIDLINENVQEISGKIIKFENQYQVNKYITLY